MPPPVPQPALAGLLGVLVLAIPFSVAAIEILFWPLLVVWGVTTWRSRRPPADATVLAPTPSLWQMPAGRGVLVPLAGFLLVCAGSVAWSRFPMLTLTGLIGKTLEYALLFVIAADVTSRDTRVGDRALQMLLAAAWLVVAYGLLQEWRLAHTALHMDPFRGQQIAYGRMVGPYPSPNDLATFLLVAVLLLLGRMVDGFGVRRKGSWVLSGLLLGCLARTTSRAAWLGFLAGLLVLLMARPRRARVWGVAGAAGLTVAGLLLFFRRADLPSVLAFTDIGMQERRAMWETGWRMFAAQPLLGQGLNTFMANYAAFAADPSHSPAYAHNCLLQLAAEVGVFGVATFGWFLASLFAACWRVLRRVAHAPSDEPEARAWLIGLVAALAAFLVQSLFDTNLYALRQATLFWTLAGVAFGMSQAMHPPSSRSCLAPPSSASSRG